MDASDTPTPVPAPPKVKVLYLRMTVEDHAALHALADKYHMTTSSYIRGVVADHLRAAKEAGL